MKKNAFSLSLLPILMILVPLCLTLYGWRLSVESTYQNASNQFKAMAAEANKALINKVESYNYALLGGEGFFHGSEFVSRDEWHQYVETIDIKSNFPGIRNLGVIFPVEEKNLKGYMKRAREIVEPETAIHPETNDLPFYILTYIEPERKSSFILGLNMAFEKNRREAAEAARDSGKPILSNKINFLHDDERGFGFLLFHPVYNLGMPTNTVEERRKAFKCWLYAPFAAKNFFADITQSQQENLHLEVYDDDSDSAGHLIYDDETSEDYMRKQPAFTVTTKLDIMEQQWTVVWKSTKAYELHHRSYTPLLILVGGLLFTGLFGLFLTVVTVRKNDTIKLITKDKKFILPVLIFLVTTSGSFYLSYSLYNFELGYVQALAKQESSKIQKLISSQTSDKILSLKRMAQRWNFVGGTPEDIWRNDAQNYLEQLSGLKSLGWVDPSYHLRRIQPESYNQTSLGASIADDPEQKKSALEAQDKDLITLTAPLTTPQGYRAFVAYAPVKKNNIFDGFIVGIFNIDDFFRQLISREVVGDFSVSLEYDGKVFFQNDVNDKNLETSLGLENSLQIYDKNIKIKIIPTDQFVKVHQTPWPFLVLIGGLIIACLSSLTLRYILISRIGAYSLKQSEETFRSAMESASIGMALVGLDGKWITVNNALCELLGYSEDELKKLDFQTITHPDDLQKDLNLVKRVLDDEIKTYELEKRYFHKNGHVIWIMLNISLVRDAIGLPKHFIAQIQDITGRKEMDRMKSEFISIVSHELRTPLTSIRGALGLIEGTMTKDLPERVRYLIGIAHKNSERLILLINDILDLDKISAGKMRFDAKDESLLYLVAHGIEENASYGQKYHVKFSADNISPDIFVHVDPDRWQQVFSNLLSNAAKFSPQNSEVKIYSIVQNGFVKLCVEDKGAGIPEEFHSRIFEKFSQADSSLTRTKGGSGLGLNISKQIIEAMNGRIGFESTLGQGTVFWIELPLAKTNR